MLPYKLIPNFKFDVVAAQEAFKQVNSQHEGHWQGDQYGGIGLTGLSKDDVENAAVGSHDALSIEHNKVVKPAKVNLRRLVVKTKACIPPYDKIIDDLAQYTPYRARLSILTPQRALKWHIDEVQKCWRVNIAIITNPGCFFEWEIAKGEFVKLHMPADGSGYFVRTDLPHRFVNDGNEDRVHFLCGVRLED